MKTVYKIIIVILLVVVAVLGFKLYTNESLFGNKQSLSVDTIKSGLADIAQLATEEYLYTSVETFQDQKTFKDFNIPLTKKSFIIKCSGVIKAGVDFGNIKVDVDEESKTISVSISGAKIISNEINNGSYEMLDEHNNLFNPITPVDANAAEQTIKEKAETDAISAGLLTKAEDNAKKVIAAFMNQYVVVGGYNLQINGN
ncbi:MAG: DUF4230 domain-containing protein [Clostridia bacterium]|nr:DUF4230 domain-containing protein [Clostridia bacterium]